MADQSEAAAAVQHVDVLIVGAGLSGIGAGYHLQDRAPQQRYAILERRAAIGGTWDLFRYPGVRSDSDMYTLGYAFKPWRGVKAIADGPAILEYVRATAREYGIDQKIRYGHDVQAASWSSEDARWTLKVAVTETDGTTVERRLTCRFLFLCSGYYRYDRGHTPDIAGLEDFSGPVAHPQFWPEGLDCAGQRVVVIGSGATAVTLVPELARNAAHVTMLQRSPTYVVAMPAIDKTAAKRLARYPAKVAYALTRWQNVLMGAAMFWFCRRFPERAKALMVGAVQRALGADYDVEKHFTPTYNPWDQRVCLVPDGDLFDALKQGSASVATDEIAAVEARGIRLASGEFLPAVIVTATGLELLPLAGLAISVDGVPLDPAATLTYRGMMYSGVPNLASCVGYTNASWTLKCDLTCEYVCRILNHMAQHGYTRALPVRPSEPIGEAPMLDFSSGYVQRAMHLFPKQGTKAPWKLYQNYLLDLITLRYLPVRDRALAFSRGGDSVEPVAQSAVG